MTLHCTTLLPELHGRNPPLHRHPISHDTNGEPPGSSPALRRSTFEATRAGDDADIFITVAGRHCTASVYMATTLHCTAILSPTTPTVSARCSPARRRTLLFQPWRSTP